MNIRSQRSIYQVVEKYLRDAQYPMTCVDLMDIREVEEAAMAEFGDDKRLATNKLSDVLGFMWRKELLNRFPAAGEKGQMARYGYTWAATVTAKPTKPLQAPKRGKVNCTITETEDAVLIEFEKFYVMVKPK